jgi:hypothetical protein
MDFPSAIGLSVQTIQGALNIAQSMKGLRGADPAIEGKVGELYAKLIEALQSATQAEESRATLVKKVTALEEEVRQLRAWNGEKEKYELRPVRTGPYAPLAFALKTEHDTAEPSLWACADCYQEGKLTVLQFEERDPGRCLVLVCRQCGSDLYVHGSREPGHSRMKVGGRRR